MHLHFTETETETQNVAVTDIIKKLGDESQALVELTKTSTKSVIPPEDSEDFSEQSMPLCTIKGKTSCNIKTFCFVR